MSEQEWRDAPLELTIQRLSIPGGVCVHCGATVGNPLTCPGCGWIDPLTRLPAAAGGVS